MFGWIDRHIWALPAFIFLPFELPLLILDEMHHAVLLAAVASDSRKDVYSSLAGSAGGLLGFALAGVAILAAFAPKEASTPGARARERRLADARNSIMKCLLSSSFFLLLVLIFSTIGLAIDDGKTGGSIVTSFVVSSCFASIVGLFVSGLGLAMAVIERNTVV